MSKVLVFCFGVLILFLLVWDWFVALKGCRDFVVCVVLFCAGVRFWDWYKAGFWLVLLIWDFS